MNKFIRMTRFPCEDVHPGEMVYIYDESHRAEPRLKYKVLRVMKSEKKIIVEVTDRHRAECPQVRGWPHPEKPMISCWNVWRWRVDRRNMPLMDNE